MQINKIKESWRNGVRKVLFSLFGPGNVPFGIRKGLNPMLSLGKGKDSNLCSLWDMTEIRTYVALGLWQDHHLIFFGSVGKGL